MKKSLIFFCLFAAAAVSAEGMKLEIISLQHRTANDIIPIIQPLVVQGGTVTGMNDQLIIKTTPTNLDEIRQILQTIDRAARRLMIYVRQDIDGETYRRDQSVSGSYSSGDVTISNRDRRGSKKGLVIAAEDEDGNRVQYRDLSTRSDLQDKNTFQVQTVEGQPAFIQSGQSIPIANQNAYISHGHIVVQDTIEYRDATSGFYVLPRLSGNRVTLLISPNMTRVNPRHGAVFDIQNVETTATGYLGEWINIGGIDSNSNRDSSGILRSSRHQEQENRTVLVKVEEIH